MNKIDWETLNPEALQVGYNVYCYYKKHKLEPMKYENENENDENIVAKVEEVTGLPKWSVKKIIRLSEEISETFGTVNFVEYEKKKNLAPLIKRTIKEYKKIHKVLPTVQQVLLILKNNKVKFDDEKVSLLLLKEGLTDAEPLIQSRPSPEYNPQRLTYIKAIKEFRQQNKTIFFLNDDQYWKNIHLPLDDIPKIIMFHESGSKGFLDKQFMVFKYKSDNEEKNVEHFENFYWVKNSILPNIPPSSVIVMNRPNKMAETILSNEIPEFSWSVNRILKWLKMYSIPYDTDCKSALFQIASRELSKLEFAVDKTFKDNGHTVLYLPANCEDLNPVIVVSKIRNVTGAESLKLLSKLSTEKWQEYIGIVREKENEYFKFDSESEASTSTSQTIDVKPTISE